MPERDADVLLISDDAQLCAAAQQLRAERLVLRCLTAGEWAANPDLTAAQVWIDLDGATVPATPGDGSRRVYFHTQPRPPADPLPLGLFIRKPASATVLGLLWAGVEADVREREQGNTPCGLPVWLLDYHELDLRVLCDKLVTQLPARLGYCQSSLYLYDARHRLLTLSQTTHGRSIDLAVPFDMDRGLMSAVAHVGGILCTDDIRAELAARGLEQVERDYGDGTCLIAPLRCENQLVGVLNLSGRRPEGPRAGEIPLQTVFTFLGRCLHHARVHERVLTEARVDCLTGLYNKRWIIEALQREIQRAERYDTGLSVLLIDLDGLKTVNDQHGHAAGDCLLQHVAGRITGVLRQFDGAARVGGDEFIVMLPNTRVQGARHVAQRLLDTLRHESARFHDLPLPITASIGIAEWLPGQRVEQLIDMADRAMYRAKQRGRNQVMAAQAAAAGIEIRPSPADVAALIEEARRVDQERARQRSARDEGRRGDASDEAPPERTPRARSPRSR